MKTFSVLFLTLVLAVLFAVAGDQPEPPTAGSQAPAFSLPNPGTALAARNTFLINPTGIIRKVYLKVSAQGHSEEVLADLQQLQSAK